MPMTDKFSLLFRQPIVIGLVLLASGTVAWLLSLTLIDTTPTSFWLILVLALVSPLFLWSVKFYTLFMALLLSSIAYVGMNMVGLFGVLFLATLIYGINTYCLKQRSKILDIAFFLTLIAPFAFWAVNYPAEFCKIHDAFFCLSYRYEQRFFDSEIFYAASLVCSGLCYSIFARTRYYRQLFLLLFVVLFVGMVAYVGGLSNMVFFL